MAITQEQCDILLAEISSLKKENEEMKALLREHGLSYHPATKKEKGEIVELYSPVVFPAVALGVEERGALFQSLFRGREDVFARRWYSKVSGKGGYQPVCVNE